LIPMKRVVRCIDIQHDLLFALHSVPIRLSPNIGTTHFLKTSYAIRGSRFNSHGEKCGLILLDVVRRDAGPDGPRRAEAVLVESDLVEGDGAEAEATEDR